MSLAKAAAEAAQIFDDRRADFAGAEDADGEVAQLAALKTRKGVVVDLCAPQGGLIFAQAKKYEHDGVICHAVRRVVGVAHLEAELLCGGEVDVVWRRWCAWRCILRRAPGRR